MSSRQARRERREAERKQKRAEMKRMKTETQLGQTILSPAVGFVSQSEPKPDPQCGFVSHNSLSRAEINRANAQYSTGPRSEVGKLASSRNSLKHGLASGTLIIPGEDPADFEALQAALLEEHRPVGDTEALLVTEMAQSWWLLQRAIRFQNACFSANGVDEKQLALFLRYQTTHERAFHKALATLVRLKQDRARQQRVRKTGFVSQNLTQQHDTPVEQTILLSDIGFVSQNTATGPPSQPAIHVEAA